MEGYLKLSTAVNITVLMIDSIDHITGKTGLSAGLTIYASKAAGTPAAITPTVTELDATNVKGLYKLAFTTSHVDTLGELQIHVTGTGADPTDIKWQVVTDLPGIAQTGDNFARLGAPAGASVSADIAAAKVDTAAIKVKTDFLPSATAGAAGGVFIAGSNAATSITTALTANVIGNVTGNLSGSVGSVTGLTASDVGAIKTQTDKLTFTVANHLDVNVLKWIGGTIPAVNVTGVPLVDLKYTLGTISPAAAGSVRADAVTGAVGSVTGLTASDVGAIKTKTDFLPSATAGAAGGVFIAGSNAATSITTALTANVIGNVTGNLSGSVGSVTGNLGGNVIGNLNGSVMTDVVGNVNGAVTSVTGAVGSVTGNVGGNVNGSVLGDLAGNVNGVVFAVGSVTGNVGGNVVGNVLGSVGWVDVGGITAASFAAGAIDAAAIATDAIDADAIKADAVTEIQSGLSTLNAAGVRTAVGLGSANLDTQLGAIAGFIDTEVASILAAVDTEVAAIKAKTDQFVFTIANQVDSNALSGGGSGLDAAGVRAAVGLASANLDTQLDALPTNAELATALGTADDAVLAQVALVKARTDLIPAAPAAVGDIPSAASVAAAVMAAIVEGSTTFVQMIRGFGAALLGKASGMATTTATFRNVDDSKDRIVATVDADGNRSAVTLDLT